MKKRIVTLLMAAVLVFGTSTTVLANSPVVNNSVVVDNTTPQAPALDDAVVDEISNKLNSEAPAEEKVEVLVNFENKASLATSMQKEPELLEAVATLEDEYASDIEKKTEIAPVLETIVKKSSIKVVGAALNAKENGEQDATLAIALPEAPVTFPTSYSNAVSVDIKLYVGNNSNFDLAVPVAITMDAPAGVTVDSSLVIRHYHDGIETEISPVLNADGTITFAVDGFSTFVFANKTVATADASYLYYLMANPYGTAGTGSVVTAPKTGEAVNVASVMAVMAMAAAAVVVVRRKVTVK